MWSPTNFLHIKLFRPMIPQINLDFFVLLAADLATGRKDPVSLNLVVQANRNQRQKQ